MKATSKHELNFLNVLFCLLVILIHILAAPLSQVLKGTWQHAVLFLPWRLSGFVVQGFILISAVKLFLKYKNTELSYINFINSRFKKIVIPYILWVCIYYIYFIKRGYFPFNMKDLLNYLWIGNLVSHFYFVIIIVQFYILLPIWLKLLKKYHPVVIIPISLLLTLFFKDHLPTVIKLINPSINFIHNDRIFTTYLIYWIAGGYIGLYYDNFKGIMEGHRKLIITQFLIAITVESTLGFIHFSGIQSIPFLEHIHVIYVIATLLFVYFIAMIYGEAITKLKLFKMVNTASYIIYLSHCLPIFVIDEYLIKYGIVNMNSTVPIRFVFVYGCMMLVSVVYSYYAKMLKVKF